MSWGVVAVVGGSIVGGAIASGATGRAADKQTKAAREGIAAQDARFAEMAEMLAPYREGGEGAISAMQALSGLSGDQEQQQAINQIQQSPQFQSQVQQGEEAILQNASATGGLRGGNVQNALGQFRPAMLANAIDQQYQQLGGLAGLGQNAAAMTGNQGMQAGANEVQLLQQAGSAQAGASIAQANIASNAIGNAAGYYLGGKF